LDFRFRIGQMVMNLIVNFESKIRIFLRSQLMLDDIFDFKE